MNYVVEIDQLTKDYQTGFWKKKTVRALDSVSLNVSGGQIFGFLGGNGAGKTTTIKILMGLLFPTSGSAKILGKNISDISMHGEIGYSPENPYFYDYLTPRELLTYFAEVFDVPTNIANTRTEALLTKVGLNERDWDKQLRKFSKGMLQRVGLAQSLVNDPKVVFLDEPMSGLDPIGRREIRELISELRDQGKTVFMSTHILSDVEALCDEVAILRRGKLAATGRLDDLLVSHADNQVFEVNLRGVDPQQLAIRLNGSTSYEIENTSSGARIRVDQENEIDNVLAAARSEGGSLISIVPVKQSLEELFVSKTED